MYGALRGAVASAIGSSRALVEARQARVHRLQVANRLVIAYMVLLLVAMVGVMLVITDILFGSVVAAIATAAGSGFFLYVWFLVPKRYRLNLT